MSSGACRATIPTVHAFIAGQGGAEGAMEWLAEQFPLVSIGEMWLRLLAALLLAFPLGMEREVRRKSAGLRTNMLVSLGACGYVFAVVQATHVLPMETEVYEYNPTGLIAAVASGIGFLGAGAIFNARGGVKGLTTGATIWLSGAVGLACGVGQIALAASLTAATVLILVVFKWLERIWFDADSGDEADR
jgi:putative Mg2+ transporter-C (MgtC) family protein